LFIYYKLLYFVTNLTLLHPVCFPTTYSTTNITYIYKATRTFYFVLPSMRHKTRSG